MNLKKTLAGVAGLFALTLAVATTTCAAYPEKPVNMIIAFTAGGSSDVQARVMQKYWNKYVDQPWVFVYKPGAGGLIGFTEIAKAKADGYTIGGLNVPHILLQSMAQRAAFNPDSYDYLGQAVNDPQCVAVLTKSPFNSVEELLAHARTNPGKLKLGLQGPLSGHHMMFLEFKRLFPDVRLSQVFYKGGADQNAALLGGEVDLIFGNVNDVMRSIDELKILAVTSETRSEFLPDVPTMKELGIDYVSDIRRVFAAPRGIPADRLAFLREVFEQICRDPEYLADMKRAGQPAGWLDGEATRAYIREQAGKIKKLLEEEGLLK